MPTLPIVIGEKNPILRKKTKKVPRITKDVLQLIADMAHTVSVAKGAGLAAPQVGRTERVCLALLGGKMQALINPEITSRSSSTTVAEEGCLSLPGVWLPITRSTEITLQFVTMDGKPRELLLKDFDARVIQHEVDHLDGVLITDHKREVVM